MQDTCSGNTLKLTAFLLAIWNCTAVVMADNQCQYQYFCIMQTTVESHYIACFVFSQYAGHIKKSIL